MTDVTNITIAGMAVVGVSMAGGAGLPDWAVLGLSASAGSLMSAGWRVMGGEIKSWIFGLMAFATGLASGIAMALLFVTVSKIEPAASTPFAFFFAMFGAKFTKSLSTGETGDSLAKTFGSWLNRKYNDKEH